MFKLSSCQPLFKPATLYETPIFCPVEDITGTCYDYNEQLEASTERTVFELGSYPIEIASAGT